MISKYHIISSSIVSPSRPEASPPRGGHARVIRCVCVCAYVYTYIYIYIEREI